MCHVYGPCLTLSNPDHALLVNGIFPTGCRRKFCLSTGQHILSLYICTMNIKLILLTTFPWVIQSLHLPIYVNPLNPLKVFWHSEHQKTLNFTSRMNRVGELVHYITWQNCLKAHVIISKHRHLIFKTASMTENKISTNYPYLHQMLLQCLQQQTPYL